MKSKVTFNDLLEWAHSEPTGTAASFSLDRGAPETIILLKAALARPNTITAVEKIEQLAKSLWPDVLTSGERTPKTDALTCGEFFGQLGFFFKYKPYGVKVASPFGYSVFDLKDGEGFSFQMHVEPKIEAFHILRAKRNSLIYISSVDEWESAGAQWAKMAMTGDEIADSPYVWRPAQGDVTAIDDTGIVHTALGCVLEEYASCSVDAVERLFDQNARHDVALPERHADAGRLLRDCHRGQPLRNLSRTAGGWRSRPLLTGEPIIHVGDDMFGARVSLRQGVAKRLDPGDDAVTLVVAVDNPVDIHVEDHVWAVPQGRFGCIPPGLEANVRASQDCCVAIHRVSRSCIGTDWSH